MEHIVTLSSESDFSDVLARAIEWHRQGHVEKAAPVYIAVLEHAPENPDALHYLGLAYRSAGDWEAARDSMQKAVDSDPEYFEALNNLGSSTNSQTIVLPASAVDAFGEAFKMLKGKA